MKRADDLLRQPVGRGIMNIQDDGIALLHSVDPMPPVPVDALLAFRCHRVGTRPYLAGRGGRCGLDPLDAETQAGKPEAVRTLQASGGSNEGTTNNGKTDSRKVMGPAIDNPLVPAHRLPVDIR